MKNLIFELLWEFDYCRNIYFPTPKPQFSHINLFFLLQINLFIDTRAVICLSSKNQSQHVKKSKINIHRIGQELHAKYATVFMKIYLLFIITFYLLFYLFDEALQINKTNFNTIQMRQDFAHEFGFKIVLYNLKLVMK